MNDFMFNNNFEQNFSMFDIMFIIVPIMIGLVFIFVFISIISPKFRGKMMSRQVKATKHMVDYSKDDIEDIGTTLGGVAVNVKKNILDENEDTLRQMADREANIKKDYVKTMAGAIQEGLNKKDTMYCKHCGNLIDNDSTFCKDCGKKQ